MNTKLLLTTLAMTLLLSGYSQSSTTGTGRDNWLPNKGPVGIGTKTPTKDLEVVGDMNVTGTSNLFDVKTGSLLNLNNAIINGRIGIGISSPTEALDVDGNAKISGNISAVGVTFQTLNANAGTFNTLTVNQTSYFGGKMGIGVNLPAEKLEVGGNLKVSNSIFSNALTTTNLQTTQFTTGSAIFNDNATFTKNITLSGKLGIGVASPIELLEVGGNIRSTGSLLSQSLTTGNAQLSDLLVSQNSIFNGLVGIGTSTPGEKLHVAGNIKADNTITSSNLNATNVQAGQLSSGIASFSDNISVSKDVIVTGKIGIGVMTPSESLDINGNLKLTGAINASSLNVNQGSFPQGLSAGNTSVSGTLNVTGLLTTQNISATSFQSTGNVLVGQDLNVSGSGVFTAVKVNDLLNSKDILVEKINATDINITQGLTVNGNTTLSGTLLLGGQLTSQNISASQLTVSGNTLVGQNLQVNGMGTINGSLSVTGHLNANVISLASINTTGNVSVGTNLSVSGLSELHGGASLIGNSSVEGNLQVSGTLMSGLLTANNLNISNLVTISQNMIVGGSGQVAGDFNVAGNIKANVVEASEFKVAGSNSPFNFDNAVISKTLAVGTDKGVPSNYTMAVGGNIIAKGVDVKIPEKWPDYVFEPEYNNLSIEELAQYIKQNKHLPGFLSANEMEEKQNYNVADMDTRLLKKIEELTLYIIQLEARLKALEK